MKIFYSGMTEKLSHDDATALLFVTAGVYGFTSTIDRSIIDYPLTGSFNAISYASLYGLGGFIIGKISPDKNLTVVASVITGIAICKELYRFFWK